MREPLINIPVLDEAKADEAYDALCSRAPEFGDAPESVRSFLSAVMVLSPFLRECALKEPEFLARMFRESVENVFEDLFETTEKLGVSSTGETDLKRDLRIAKRRLSLLCGLADLAGWCRNEQITECLSGFAGAAIRAAFDFILLDQHRLEKLTLPDPTSPQTGSGLVVLGMGKLGAGELNYSSDIDLIVFHDERSSMVMNTDDPITLLNRMGKTLIRVLQERTEDGYVFRTDLRLRPDPSSTPLVIPVEAALNYYEGQGQNWERSAMIKARPVAGDLEAANWFLDQLRPFIWRKYLDFAAINDIHSIKRQIHAHKGHGSIAVFGHNIKLGRGGIREIEFFAQTQQLIAGGRNDGLRECRTVDALSALVAHDWLQPDAAVVLKEAYWFLRSLEHRLQMVRDEQTHTVPENADEFAGIAALHGESNTKAFEKRIQETLECVEAHYANLFERSPELNGEFGNLVFTGDDPDPDTVETLRKLGYARPLDIIKTIKAWHVARVPALRTNQAREMLTELTPTLLDAFSRAHKPDEVVFAFDRFLSGLPAGIQLFSLLKNNEELCEHLVRILDAAPRLADQISRKPHVFDAMLEPDGQQDAVDRDGLEALLNTALNRSQSYEQTLDAARMFNAENRFRIGMRYFAGLQDYQKTAHEFSLLAEVVTARMFDAVIAEFESVHGCIAGGKVCILAMGRLGSCELTATSDLDLIFLYDAPDDNEQSDGAKPLYTAQYYVRLMQRFITAMTAPTSEGILYSLDFRLRPSGNAGPLATQASSFFTYQKTEAWVWEAQALTRARPIHGDQQLVETVKNEIAEILKTVEERHPVTKEIAKMRGRIEKEKGSKDPWNVKAVSGGLLDLEFLAQWYVLTNPAQVSDPGSTRAALEAMSAAGVCDLVHAYDMYSDILHLGRVTVGDTVSRDEFPVGLAQVLCSRLEVPSIEICEVSLKETQSAVRKAFKRLVGKP